MKTVNTYPYVHFTARKGWINDPNGLVAYTSPLTGKTVYHLFFQHNPNDVVWGDMHWGHAISEDLFHWKELPIALYPDEKGTMFSGSAVVDKENRTGLKEGKEDVILLYYTCAGNRFTQNLAYSTDGGITFKKYRNNPLIAELNPGNRDPKVIFCEELNKFLLALYFDGFRYELFVSSNLLDWEFLQEVIIEGDGECPDIYPLCVDGNAQERRWVIGGAAGRYVVGEFREGKFVPLQESRQLCYSPDHCYASQTYSGLENGRRIGFGWQRNLPFDGAPFCGQMSVPLELSLHRDGEEYTLRAQPIAEISALTAEKEVIENLYIEEEKPYEMPLNSAAYQIRVDTEEDCDFTITVFGQEICLKKGENSVQVGNNSFSFEKKSAKGGFLLIVDKYSAEMFFGEGEAFITAPLLCDYSCAALTVSAPTAVRIKKLEVTRLTSIAFE